MYLPGSTFTHSISQFEGADIRLRGMAEEQKRLQSLSDDYQKLQDDLQTAVSARQTLESQLAENQAVSAEFSTLSDSSKIYKLIGPVLLKQDKTDAVTSVNGRLEFIDKEIKRTEGRIKDLQTRSEKKRAEVMGLQQTLQAAQQQGQVKG